MHCSPHRGAAGTIVGGCGGAIQLEPTERGVVPDHHHASGVGAATEQGRDRRLRVRPGDDHRRCRARRSPGRTPTTPPHTATADDSSFDTGDLDKGDSKSVTFDKPGTFTYYCRFHPFMKATVEVQ